MRRVSRRTILALGLAGAVPLARPPIAAAAGLPILDRKNNDWLSEGPTDFGLSLNAVGTVRAQMVFVDFPDAPGDAGGTASVADHLTGGGKAQAWFREQSHGRLAFEIKQVAGWQRLSKPSSAYTGADKTFTFEQHKSYISEAAALFPEIDMGVNQILFVVAATTDAIANSPAFIPWPADAPVTKTGPICWGVTFGKDSYSNTFINLCHEVCHTFGLPDLYNFKPFGFTIGAWDIMCDIFQGTSLIGWQRHKLGWLAENRAVYLTSGRLDTVLTPLPSPKGTSMIVVPAAAGRPSKVYAIELAQPIRGLDGTTTGDGVLVYSVDASVPTGQGPVQIVPAKTSTSSVYGALFEAPFQAGSRLDDPALPFRLAVKERGAEGYAVAVELR